MEAVKQGSAVVGLRVRGPVCAGGGRSRIRELSRRRAGGAGSPARKRPVVMPCFPLFASRQSNTHVVLGALNRAQSELASYQRKIFKLDDHMGIAMAGLNADGRVLTKYMRAECIDHKCAPPPAAASLGMSFKRAARVFLPSRNLTFSPPAAAATAADSCTSRRCPWGGWCGRWPTSRS